MRQVISGLVMFVTGAAVTGALHKLLRLHIILAQAVDDDMDMDVSASMTSVRVSTDQCLVPREILFCIFHANGLCPLRCQAIRAAKTMFQTGAALVVTQMPGGSVDWMAVGSAVIVAGVASLGTSLAGLPELEKEDNA